MIGVLIRTHGNLGYELIKAAEMIKGDTREIIPISLDAKTGVEDIKKEIIHAITKADSGEGVLIMTDLFGGTPSNISLSFLEENKVEVVTGVNLPMLLKISDIREEKKDLTEFANLVKVYGRKNIYLASEILNRKAGD
ncbi:MAG: PTS sugar transporter subunit IIA [Syntrophobacterales bacterium]|nr:MAG: PTS sugar transporter subunit IIA [Syntrophobacterales bacterium]